MGVSCSAARLGMRVRLTKRIINREHRQLMMTPLEHFWLIPHHLFDFLHRQPWLNHRLGRLNGIRTPCSEPVKQGQSQNLATRPSSHHQQLNVYRSPSLKRPMLETQLAPLDLQFRQHVPVLFLTKPKRAALDLPVRL